MFWFCKMDERNLQTSIVMEEIVKRLAYWLYGFLFHLFRICPVRKKKVVLFMIHNSKFRGSLKFIHDEMKKRDSEFEFVVVSKKQLFSVSGKGMKKIVSLCKGAFYFYVILNYHMATAGYIFLNDNFQPLAYMNVSKKTKVVQVWHGVGAFKRFGLSTEKDPVVRNCTRKGNQKVTHLFVSSEQVILYYAEAMGMEESRIYADGIPVTDYYFDEEMKCAGREHVYQEYPELKGKKILLYTPTFRESEEENKALLCQFDYKAIKKRLGEEWAVLVRLHPQIHKQVSINESECYDVTEYRDIKELYTVADVLVNDYSSTVVEYALFDKPIILYAYDLEKYDRGFYRDYKENAPGIISYTQEELMQVLDVICGNTKDTAQIEEMNQVMRANREHFLSLQYDYMDGMATKRVVDRVLEKRKNNE